jgi:hypothetical protein
MDLFAQRRDPVKVPSSEGGVDPSQDSMKVQLLVIRESREKTGGALCTILNRAAKIRTCLKQIAASDYGTSTPECA